MTMLCFENNRNNRTIAPHSITMRGHKSHGCKPFSMHSQVERVYYNCIKVVVLIGIEKDTSKMLI